MVSFGSLIVNVLTFAGSFFSLASAAPTDVSEEKDTFSPQIQCAIQK